MDEETRAILAPVAEAPPKPLMDRPLRVVCTDVHVELRLQTCLHVGECCLIKTVASMIFCLASTHMYGRQQIVDCFLHSDIHEAESSAVYGDALAKFPKLPTDSELAVCQS
jgi:hypothetical protein